MERVKFYPPIRFHALTRVLGVSINTLYLWRRGGLPNTPALQVEVKPVKNKNVVWVLVPVLELWLKENRPKLLKKLRRYLKTKEPKSEAELRAIALKAVETRRRNAAVKAASVEI